MFRYAQNFKVPAWVSVIWLLSKKFASASRPHFHFGSCGFQGATRHREAQPQIFLWLAKRAWDEGFWGDAFPRARDANQSFDVTFIPIHSDCRNPVVAAKNAIPAILGRGNDTAGRIHDASVFQDPIQLIFGCECSEPSEMVSALALMYNIPMMGYSSSQAYDAARPNYMRTNAPEYYKSYAEALVCKLLGWRRLVWLAVDGDASSEPCLNAFQFMLAKINYDMRLHIVRATPDLTFDGPHKKPSIHEVEQQARAIAFLRPQPRIFKTCRGPAEMWTQAFYKLGLASEDTVWFTEKPSAKRGITYSFGGRFFNATILSTEAINFGFKYYSQTSNTFFAAFTKTIAISMGAPQSFAERFPWKSFVMENGQMTLNTWWAFKCYFAFDAATAVFAAVSELLGAGERAEEIKGDMLKNAVLKQTFEGLTGWVKFDGQQISIQEHELYQITGPETQTRIGRTYNLSPPSNKSTLEVEVPIRFGNGIEDSEGKASGYVVPLDRAAPCNPGEEFQATHTETGHLNVCAPCPLGKANLYDDERCHNCDSGRYADKIGMSVCELAPPGHFVSFRGQSTYEFCSLGHVSSLNGSSRCSFCSFGQYSDAAGATSCKLCGRGSYANSTQASACTPCDGIQTTRDLGASSSHACVCPEDFYIDQKLCLPCPDGMACEPGSNPQVKSGYMTLADEPLKVFKCISNEVCPGVPLCADRFDPSKIACGECIDGAYQVDDHTCKSCGGGLDIVIVAIAITFGVVGVGAVAYLANRNLLLQPDSTRTCVALLSITVMSVQTLAIFDRIVVEWLSPLNYILRGLHVVRFDLRTLRLSCSFPVTPLNQFLSSVLLAPLCVLVVLLALILKKFSSGLEMPISVEFTNTIGAVFQVLFIPMVLSTFQPLMCYAHPSRNGESMYSAPSILCFVGASVDDTHNYLLGIGIVAFILVPVPFLVFCIVATMKYPCIVRNSHADARLILWACRFLFLRFNAERYFYGVLMLVRNMAICLVPVVARNNPSVQVLICSCILIGFTVVQLMLQPWKSRLVNIVDGACVSILIILLLCASMTTDFHLERATLGHLTTGVFVALLVLLSGGLAKTTLDRLVPSPFYAHFICHHKGYAAAQARWLQIRVTEKSGRACFIDSDDLADLNSLFDIVRCKVGHLIVYLTAHTLSRPWCAGEIVTSHKRGLRTTVIQHPSFTAPSATQMNNLSDYLDLTSCNLEEHSIPISEVANAFHWLLSGAVPIIPFPDERGREKFEGVLMNALRQGRSFVVEGMLCNVAHIATSTSLPNDKVDQITFSSDPLDDEATATTAILIHLLETGLFGIVGGEPLMLADCVDDTREQLINHVRHSRAVVVIFTQMSLEALHQLQVIMVANSVDDSMLVPVHTPAFVFPSALYYSAKLPLLLGTEAAVAATCLENVFRKISVFFPTHASFSVLNVHSQLVKARVLSIPRVTTKRDYGDPGEAPFPVITELAEKAEKSLEIMEDGKINFDV